MICSFFLRNPRDLREIKFRLDLNHCHSPQSKSYKQMTMKKLMFIFFFLTWIGAGIAEAQRAPRANARQRHQQARISEGVRSGELTRSETRRLRTEQRHIRRTERRMKADGKMTGQERVKLQRKQNRASRDIRRQKNDVQVRPQ